MLVFFVYDLFAVTDDILEKVISALLQTQRMEFRICRIPIVLVSYGINIVNT